VCVGGGGGLRCSKALTRGFPDNDHQCHRPPPAQEEARAGLWSFHSRGEVIQPGGQQGDPADDHSSVRVTVPAPQDGRGRAGCLSVCVCVCVCPGSDGLVTANLLRRRRES